jgi:hypothetical protein
LGTEKSLSLSAEERFTPKDLPGHRLFDDYTISRRCATLEPKKA